jgi:hypothetical protein
MLVHQTGHLWKVFALASVWAYSNSNSIFFVAESSFAIRNLQICPARNDSGLASSAGAPLFQRARSMEPSDDKSGVEDA